MGIVDGPDHAVGIGKFSRVEPVRAPVVDRLGGPILPVLDDVVQRDAALAKTRERREQLRLVLVMVARLPESERPLRQHRRPAGERTKTRNDAVQRRPLDEAVVDALADVGPQGRGDVPGGGQGRFPEEAQDIGALAIRLDLQGVAFPRLEPDLDLVVLRQPVLPPVVHNEPPVEPHLEAAVGICLELVVARDRRDDRALRAGRRMDAIGAHAATATIGTGKTDRRGYGGRGQPAVRREVSGGDPAGPAGGVAERVGRDRRKRPEVAKAGEGRVVPQHPVAAAGDEERDDDVGVALPEVEVVALEIDDAELQLAETVE